MKFRAAEKGLLLLSLKTGTSYFAENRNFLLCLDRVAKWG